jgi:hypothetical protein
MIGSSRKIWMRGCDEISRNRPLSPLSGLGRITLLPHGLRRGLHSNAASRLGIHRGPHQFKEPATNTSNNSRLCVSAQDYTGTARFLAKKRHCGYSI